MITDGGENIGQAGTIQAGDIWTRVTFAEKFDSIPVVVASPMTTNNATQGVVRVRSVGIAGFDVRFEEYPSDFDDFHPLESIGWIAIEPGTWTLDGKKITAWTVGSVTDSYSSVSFQTLSNPVILSQVQRYNEIDYGSHTRVKNVSTTGFDVKIEEETDTTHTSETVGYIAIESGTIKSGSAKVSETKYYPYGVTQEGGSDKYLYTGKELDKGTGLYYYEARYYNPNVGRFIQPDTIIPDVYNPQSLNRYSYVLNNPIRYVDPSGNFYNPGDAEFNPDYVEFPDEYNPEVENEFYADMVERETQEMINQRQQGENIRFVSSEVASAFLPPFVGDVITRILEDIQWNLQIHMPGSYGTIANNCGNIDCEGGVTFLEALGIKGKDSGWVYKSWIKSGLREEELTSPEMPYFDFSPKYHRATRKQKFEKYWTCEKSCRKPNWWYQTITITNYYYYDTETGVEKSHSTTSATVTNGNYEFHWSWKDPETTWA